MNEKRIKKYIIWTAEHYHSFLDLRDKDTERAEDELNYLRDCIENLMKETQNVGDTGKDQSE